MATTRRPKGHKKWSKDATRLAARVEELELDIARMQSWTTSHTQLKAACHSLTVRLMTYLTTPTPQHLYAVHQILRDVEALTGDAAFR